MLPYAERNEPVPLERRLGAVRELRHGRHSGAWMPRANASFPPRRQSRDASDPIPQKGEEGDVGADDDGEWVSGAPPLSLCSRSCARRLRPPGPTQPPGQFARPANAPAKVASLGDDYVRDIIGRVSVVRLAPGESTAEALADYRSRDDVAYAEPNLRLHLLDLNPDDTYYASQWALSTIAAPAGWSLFPGTFAPSPFGAVGIVDTGVDGADTRILQGRIDLERNLFWGPPAPQGIPIRPDGHGLPTCPGLPELRQTTAPVSPAWRLPRR